jgi:hypothetical protein
VYVLNLQGKPLMPCSYAKSKRLVKKGAAKVISRSPFTIQLTFECENSTQDITLGIDTGAKNIGFSAVSEKSELLVGTLKLDAKTKKRLESRAAYRQNRRSRLWHREPRFNNRAIPKGWLPPSIQRKYQTHLTLINKIKSILPVSDIIVEIGKFDIQRLENPDIKSIDYQQGTLYDYHNMASYLKAVQKNKCPFCKQNFKSGEPKAIHHRHRRGDIERSNRPEGLILFHKKCHIKLHAKGREKEFQNVKVNSYKQSAFMNIINKKFLEDVPDLKTTFGYVTFVNRNKINLEKTHYNDAFVIAKGNTQERIKSIEITQVHRNNRVLQINKKGFKPSIRREKSKATSGDLFWIGRRAYHCKGTSSYGRYIRHDVAKIRKYFKFSEVTKLFHRGSLIWKFI